MDFKTSNMSIGVVSGGAAFVLAVLIYFVSSEKTTDGSSRKSKQAREMRLAYNSIENKGTKSKRNPRTEKAEDPWQISEIWLYPIKSIRGCRVSSAMITPEGFYLDRRYMLLAVQDTTPPTFKNMHVPHYPKMCLFETSIMADRLIVKFNSPESGPDDTLEVPLEPESLEGLETVDVVMHSSPTTGYNLGPKYNDWLSERFGFPVVLTFWGGNGRPVLGNRPGKPTHIGKPSSPITRFLNSIPIIGPFLGDEGNAIAFNDCAPFLVVNDASVEDVDARLGEGVEADVSKFRPNIIVKGNTSAFEEDFWGELICGHGTDESRIILTGNCGRCTSLNVDYETGKFGKGKDGQVLKLLQKDRRVDPGYKYSPIFGRYGFPGQSDTGKVLRVGDGVVLSKRNEERTTFYWPGLSTTP